MQTVEVRKSCLKHLPTNSVCKSLETFAFLALLRFSGEKPENRLSAKMPLLRWIPPTSWEKAFIVGIAWICIGQPDKPQETTLGEECSIEVWSACDIQGISHSVCTYMHALHTNR